MWIWALFVIHWTYFILASYYDHTTVEKDTHIFKLWILWNNLISKNVNWLQDLMRIIQQKRKHNVLNTNYFFLFPSVVSPCVIAQIHEDYYITFTIYQLLTRLHSPYSIIYFFPRPKPGKFYYYYFNQRENSWMSRMSSFTFQYHDTVKAQAK